ncbi:hypothetical protein [Acetobacter orientalis]|uniref:Uncharacterized protein n=1 Tax=Acetobacter orientalis TaxID=146474 RepID=A0A0D6NJ94_9PROT|nr:hypothetical protein [Acetobacter orientalis]GAN65690.1 hypothetical protein Abor_012_029 [Acetobacter orientalis]GBR14142.1 hypothetical protein AA0481_0535 [Acetobacter orientalis NRIC 0481]GEL60817.1 hypothetical protein AOR02nite_06590 [Acetobacter orientalis]
MTGLYLPHVRDLLVKPALAALPAGLNSLSAQQGVLGIGLKESGYTYLRQLGTGPALGFWQMEPATHDDLWRNFIRYHPELQAALSRLLNGTAPTAQALVTNPLYAAAMCRVHLLRQPDPLPAANDATAWAAYWKQHYNTPGGAGVAAQAVPCFRAAMEA